MGTLVSALELQCPIFNRTFLIYVVFEVCCVFFSFCCESACNDPKHRGPPTPNTNGVMEEQVREDIGRGVLIMYQLPLLCLFASAGSCVAASSFVVLLL